MTSTETMHEVSGLIHPKWVFSLKDPCFLGQVFPNSSMVVFLWIFFLRQEDVPNKHKPYIRCIHGVAYFFGTPNPKGSHIFPRKKDPQTVADIIVSGVDFFLLVIPLTIISPKSQFFG